MLKKYKNELFQMIKTSNHFISDFLSKEQVDEFESKTFTIVHLPSSFEFDLWNIFNDYEAFNGTYTVFMPNLQKVSYPPRQSSNEFPSCDFDIVKHHLLLWLMGIDEYMADLLEPDLWANLTDSQNLIDETDKESLEYFNPIEKESVRLAIRDLKQLIEKKFDMNDIQKEIVSDRMDYLTAAVDRLNKFDWKGTTLNTMVSLTITLSLDTASGKQLFDLFKVVLGSIVKLLH